MSMFVRPNPLQVRDQSHGQRDPPADRQELRDAGRLAGVVRVHERQDGGEAGGAEEGGEAGGRGRRRGRR